MIILFRLTLPLSVAQWLERSTAVKIVISSCRGLIDPWNLLIQAGRKFESFSGG